MKSQRIPTVLVRAEIEALIALAEEDIETSQTAHKRFNATRNASILRLFWSTGLRVTELANLNLESVFPEEQRLKIRLGKFGNNSYQPVKRPDTWKALEKYLALREGIEGKGSALFISFYGQRILARQIGRYLKDYARRAGIRKNVFPHVLRHSFLSEYYNVTNDLLATQRVARHKSIESTKIYIHIHDKVVVDGLVKANL